MKDVCAFANADGGDLVYGIAERDAVADAPFPILEHSADSVRRRMLQILDGIEPRINGISMHDVSFTEGGFVWVVRVPASFEAPHRLLHDGHSRFVTRNGTVTSDMTYDQLRTAFDRSATLAERARQFREKRCALIADGSTWRPIAEGPIAVVHLVPIAAMTGRSSVDVATLHDQGYMAFAQNRWGAMTTRTLNFDGLLVHPSVDDETDLYAFSQVYRSGCLETVRNVTHTYEGPEVIPSTVVATYVREMVNAFARGAVQLGFAGPAIVAVSVLRVSGVRLGLGEGYRKPLAGRSDRKNLLLPEAWIGALDGFDAIDSVVRPILDTMWQCFDEPRCLEYDREGNWHPASLVGRR